MRRALKIYRRFVIAGIVVSMLAAGAAYVVQRRALEAAEFASASSQLEDVRQRLTVALGELQATAAFVEQASPVVSRFQSFLGRLPISRDSDIPWIWGRVIKPGDAAAFEAAMRAELATASYTIERQDSRTYFAPVISESGKAEATLGQDLSRIAIIDLGISDVLRNPGRRQSLSIGSVETSLARDYAFVGLVFPAVDTSRPPSVLLRGFSLAVLRMAGGLSDDQGVRVVDVTNGTPRSLIDVAPSDGRSSWMPVQTIDVGDFRLDFSISQPRPRSFPWLWLPLLSVGLLATFFVVTYRAAELNRTEASNLGATLSGTKSELTAAQRRERTFFENAGTANCETDFETGKLARVNEAMCRMFGYTQDELIGKSFAEITHPDDVAKSKGVLRDGDGKPVEQIQFEKRYLRKDGTVMWGLVNGRLMFDADGNPLAYSTVIIDITLRKSDEETKSMLLRELAHRVRNTVQLTSSLARQTGRTARNVKEYESKFMRRLSALSGAQDLLFDTGWQAAPLQQLAERVIKPFRPEDDDPARIEIDLPDINLPTQQAQTISIALHELTSNSATFGALAHGGEIRLTAELLPADAGGSPVLDFKWAETVNKRIRRPRKSGFGLIMLESALPDQFGGTAHLTWHSRGLTYEARLPLP